jgi:hypothetical protein
MDQKPTQTSTPVSLPQVTGEAPLQHHHQVDNRTELEKFVTRSVGEMQSNWDGFGSKVVLYLSLGLLLIAAIVYWTRTKDNEQIEAWSSLSLASSPVDLETIATNFPNLAAGQWAALQAADGHLTMATQMMFQDRKSAPAELKAARDGYEGILKGGNFPVEIKQRAQYGLARVLETSSTGELEPAIKAYEEAVKLSPDSVTAGLAKKRIEELKQPGAKEFYAWFSQQNPVREDLEAPKDGQTPSTSLAPEAPMMNSTLTNPAGSTTSPSMTSPLSDAETSTTAPPLMAPLSSPATSADPAFNGAPAEAPAVTPATETPVTPAPAAEAPMKEEPKTDAPVPTPATESPSTTPEAKPAGESQPAAPATTEKPAEPAPASNPL